MNAIHELFYGPIAAIGGVVAYCYVFWLLYVLVMGLYRASLDGKLTGLTLWLAYPIVLFAIAVDLIANWTIACVVFAELPNSFLELVTGRLSRYIDGPDGWRKDRATWVCHTLLDLFDPTGKHCK